MIYVTGDLHGDINRFRSRALKRLKKNDYLIVCGDFGFLWDGSKKEKRLLKWIGKRRYHVLFVEGTHDNLDLLEQYPLNQWNGGVVREISGKLKHLCRGHVFRIDGIDIFAFGGGESKDADTRESWWRQELPSLEEIDVARKNLERMDARVDYIVTHQCSRKTKIFLTMDDNEVNVMDTFFDEVRTNCTYKRWFFGSLHINKQIPPHEIALYDSVLPVSAEKL